MYRSPVKTRSAKAPFRTAVDKRKPVSPLSVNIEPSGDLAGTMESAVEACVVKHLSADRFFDSLAEKLAGRIERVVEDVVARVMMPYITEVKALREQVLVLETKLQTLNGNMNSYDELEQYQRRNNIRVFGVPELAEEDTDHLVVQLFQEKLGVEVAVEQIDRSHRVGRKREQQGDGSTSSTWHRPIIVKFVSYRDRRRVFSSKKKLKGSGITIVEDLTSSRRELLQKATVKYGRGKTWTQDGKVMWVDNTGKKCMATRLAEL